MCSYSLYKYYQGGIHKVITVGIESEKGSRMVVHEDEQRQVIVTSSDVFNGIVNIDGREIERFEYIGDTN